MDDDTLVGEVAAFSGDQLRSYGELRDMTRRILSRVVLSHGDISGVLDVFKRKQALLHEISARRAKAKETIELWQRRKATVRETRDTRELETTLQAMESTIKEFLDSEEQLQRYLEHAANKGDEQQNA